ncbi:hypothetical protein BH10PSE12_BH10PSE12_07430 [soil metagenome]
MRIEKFGRDRPLDRFDCGREAPNRFRHRLVRSSQLARRLQTYIALTGEALVGFYTVVVGDVDQTGAPERLIKGIARHPIPLPLVTLARLGVSIDWRGRGHLEGIRLRTLQPTDIAGIRALAAHAKNDEPRAFYERYGFITFSTDPYHLLLLLKGSALSFTARSRTRPRKCGFSCGVLVSDEDIEYLCSYGDNK